MQKARLESRAFRHLRDKSDYDRSQIRLERTLEAKDTSPLVFVDRIPVAVGYFRLDQEVLNWVPLDVRGSSEDLRVGVGKLQVPLQLFVDRNANAAPNCP